MPRKVVSMSRYQEIQALKRKANLIKLFAADCVTVANAMPVFERYGVDAPCRDLFARLSDDMEAEAANFRKLVQEL